MHSLPLLLVLIGWLASVEPVAAQTTFLFLNSQPGDYIGGGISQTFAPADGVFNASRNFDNGVSVSFFGEPGNFWFLDFAAPGDVALAVGVYENATRFPFQAPTNAGLSVHGQGRGCNTLTGRFEVLEIVYGPGGEVNSFAADFEQHCEGATPALFGSIRFNAGPIPQRCRSEVTSFLALRVAVLASSTSPASKATLMGVLANAEATLNEEHLKSARQWMLIFLQDVVNRAELGGRNPQRIEPSAADALICGASNLLINLISP